MKKTENQMLVIFGASGDLTARKLIPAIFNLYVARQLPENFVVLGASRSDLSDAQFRDRVVYKSPYLKEKIEDLKENYIQGFADRIFYEDLGGTYDTEYTGLRKRVEALKEEFNTSGNIIYYLSTPPTLYETIAQNLANAGLNTQNNGWKRLIVEKPFGYSLETAKNLNNGLHQYFDEPQIYRIDHYLGKETVQNLLVTRFSNSIFEPLWNRNYVDHIQITVAEEVTLGRRAGYYDTAGVLRDMFQNHLLQLMMIT
ncbi:MAG: glucose-6-phosphate dehydrogenase, partial [Bacteroidota bacterium]